ncbi:MAG: metallophosphoesterase, partial [Clostridia bacterium]|nr:metallophosphoesterase [Clostridia bacterium]
MDLKNSLKFNENGKFKVLMMSDFHVGARCNPKLIKAMDALIEYSEPDLVILGGDLMTVSRDNLDEEDFRDALAVILEPMERRGIPWMHVFGNHDKEGGYSNEFQQ